MTPRDYLLFRLASAPGDYNDLTEGVKLEEKRAYYSALQQLVAEGLVTRHTGEDDDEFPIYTITAEGRYAIAQL